MKGDPLDLCAMCGQAYQVTHMISTNLPLTLARAKVIRSSLVYWAKGQVIGFAENHLYGLLRAAYGNLLSLHWTKMFGAYSEPKILENTVGYHVSKPVLAFI